MSCDSSSVLELSLAVATTTPVACVTLRDAVPSAVRFIEPRGALTRLATTSCAVEAAISCAATTKSN